MNSYVAEQFDKAHGYLDISVTGYGQTLKGVSYSNSGSTRDQLSDAVHTIASNSATVNATGIIRNLLTDTTAQLYGMKIIEDVARSQIESALLILSDSGNQTATTTGMTATGSQLTLETETELTCEYMNRSYAECKITMNIG